MRCRCVYCREAREDDDLKPGDVLAMLAVAILFVAVFFGLLPMAAW